MLVENRITSQSADKLISSIGKNAKKIDISKNNIGKVGIEAIIRQIKNRDCKIEYLNIEDNKLGDKAVEQLCSHLAFNKVLQILNISKNYLTNNVAQSISSLLSSNDNLVELYLHWN